MAATKWGGRRKAEKVIARTAGLQALVGSSEVPIDADWPIALAFEETHAQVVFTSAAFYLCRFDRPIQWFRVPWAAVERVNIEPTGERWDSPLIARLVPRSDSELTAFGSNGIVTLRLADAPSADLTEGFVMPPLSGRGLFFSKTLPTVAGACGIVVETKSSRPAASKPHGEHPSKAPTGRTGSPNASAWAAVLNSEQAMRELPALDPSGFDAMVNAIQDAWLLKESYFAQTASTLADRVNARQERWAALASQYEDDQFVRRTRSIHNDPQVKEWAVSTAEGVVHDLFNARMRVWVTRAFPDRTPDDEVLAAILKTIMLSGWFVGRCVVEENGRLTQDWKTEPFDRELLAHFATERFHDEYFANLDERAWFALESYSTSWIVETLKLDERQLSDDPYQLLLLSIGDAALHWGFAIAQGEAELADAGGPDGADE